MNFSTSAISGKYASKWEEELYFVMQTSSNLTAIRRCPAIVDI